MKIKNVDRAVAKAFGIKISSIRESNRRREFADARQMAWLLLKDSGFTVMELSRNYKRTHGAICMGIARMRGLIGVHRKIEEIYKEIKEEL